MLSLLHLNFSSMGYPKFAFLFALILVCTTLTYGQTGLRKIIESQKFGFIDSTGNEIIPAVFHDLGDFCEGLAAVRIGGKYGYINEKWEFIIAPQFDHAMAFTEGKALIYEQKKMFFIDKKGNKVCSGMGIRVGDFQNGFAEVTTRSYKKGLIDTAGKLVFDTIFYSIGAFSHGVAVFTILSEKDGSREYAVLDKKGRVVIPFGTYSEIYGFKNGFGQVAAKDKTWEGLIDTLGDLFLRLDHATINLNEFHGLNAIHVKRQVESGAMRKEYMAVVNQKGEFLIDNPAFQNILPFSEGRAFAKDSNWNWVLIDTLGRVISSEKYRLVLDGQFIDGFTWVQSRNEGWKGIDKQGNVLFRTTLMTIVRMPGSKLLKYEHTAYDKNWNVEKVQYGITNQFGQQLTPPVYDYISYDGFQNGLLLARIQSSYQYLDKSGQIRWQQAPNRVDICDSMNIDHLIDNYFRAAAPRHPKDIGGFAYSDNFPQKIRQKKHFAPNELKISIRNDLPQKGLCDWGIYISNLSSQTQYFQAQDSHLYLDLQAKNEAGAWESINSWYVSDCGNSFHLLTLPHGYYWSFAMPSFEGGFSTVLRAELKVVDQMDEGQNNVLSSKYIYSNEIKVKLNPGQFWKGPSNPEMGIVYPYWN